LELRAWDAEGNESSYPIYIEVQQEGIPPSVSIHSSLTTSGYRATTPLSGVLPTVIEFYGSAADWDNKDPYDPYYQDIEPWLGITSQHWQAIPPTPFCVMPTFSAWERSIVLYPYGSTIPPDCQGRWRIQLAVTDDDRTTRSATAEHTITIGNCSGKVCLDSPKQLTPVVLSSQQPGGVFIGYHIDSALYDETVFGLGIYTQLEIFLEDNPLNPVYSSVSGPATQTSRGRPIPLYWNGLTQSGTQVPEGKYFNVKVTLLDANSNVLGSQIEYRAITSEPMKVVFNEPSTKYVKYNGSDTMSFTVTGAQSPVDSYRGSLRDSTGTVVANFTAPASATTMTFNHPTSGFYTFELFAIRGTSAISLGSHPVVIYTLRFNPFGMLNPSSITDASNAQWGLLVNNDDDNLNGVPDVEDAFPSGDDEIRGLYVYFRPAFNGTLTLEHTLGDGILKTWTTVSKTAEVTLPKTWNFPETASSVTNPYTLYFEALKEAKGEVRLRFTMADGVSLPEVSFRLNTVLLEAVQDTDNDHVIEDEDAVLRTVRPGRWDNAYDAAFNVRNSVDPDHFVDLDPSRFYLRAQGPSLDADSSMIDTFRVNLSTRSSSSTYDGSTLMLLPETGVSTSTMVSRSLMLTGLDIEGIPRTNTDDGFPVHDGISNVVNDSWPGDRTWRTSIDGHLVLNYTPPDNSTQVWRLPICGESRRVLPLRIHVFREPFLDVGFDDDGNPSTDNYGSDNGIFNYTDANGNGQHDLGERSELYVDLSDPMTDMVPRSGDDPAVLSAWGPLIPINDIWRELRHTDILWSPACIKTEVVGGTILVEDAPTYNFTNILMDGVMTEPELSELYRVHSGSMTEEVIDVFYGTQQNFGIISAGIAFPPYYQTPALPHGEKLFTVVQNNLSSYGTLAHELAHLLTNTADSAGNPTFFYPTNAPITPLTTVNSGRRMPEWVALDARTSRPAGDLAAHGNRQLKAY
jgi:hypothetical protein